jgi:hypothetical protein
MASASCGGNLADWFTDWVGRRVAKKLYMNSNAVQSYESTTVDDNGDNIHPTLRRISIIFSFCILSLVLLN